MTRKVDWSAPIEPGSSILGLQLGMTLHDVQEALGGDSMSVRRVTSFLNSPKLIVDASEEGVIRLRVAEMKVVNYDWQDVVARLIFEQNVLKLIVVEFTKGDEAYRYQGRVFGKIGLGSRVSEMLEFASLEYDDAEELFYSDSLSGLELGGTTACDLATDPSQIITSIRIFRHAEYLEEGTR